MTRKIAHFIFWFCFLTGATFLIDFIITPLLFWAYAGEGAFAEQLAEMIVFSILLSSMPLFILLPVIYFGIRFHAKRGQQVFVRNLYWLTVWLLILSAIIAIRYYL